MAYVECFIASVPEDRREDYVDTARQMAAIHKELGALSVTECWGGHVPDGTLTSYPMAVRAEPGEVVVTGWIHWPSKETRDAAFEAMMADPRMQALFPKIPIDGKRMIFGGFEPVVSL